MSDKTDELVVLPGGLNAVWEAKWGEKGTDITEWMLRWEGVSLARVRATVCCSAPNYFVFIGDRYLLNVDTPDEGKRAVQQYLGCHPDKPAASVRDEETRWQNDWRPPCIICHKKGGYHLIAGGNARQEHAGLTLCLTRGSGVTYEQRFMGLKLDELPTPLVICRICLDAIWRTEFPNVGWRHGVVEKGDPVTLDEPEDPDVLCHGCMSQVRSSLAVLTDLPDGGKALRCPACITMLDGKMPCSPDDPPGTSDAARTPRSSSSTFDSFIPSIPLTIAKDDVKSMSVIDAQRAMKTGVLDGSTCFKVSVWTGKEWTIVHWSTELGAWLSYSYDGNGVITKKVPLGDGFLNNGLSTFNIFLTELRSSSAARTKF